MDRAKWLDEQRDQSGFTSVDPAPPQSVDSAGNPTDAPSDPAQDVVALRNQLLNRDLRMFERMRAVFALRNLGGPDAIDALTAAFADPSALLRHELAYVLGQMQDNHAVPALIKVLEDDGHIMVRHEAAEALGAIGDEAARPTLEKYLHDPDIEVAESCDVALDLLNWMQSKELHY